MPGVVLVLVALLGPTYCGLQDEVQEGAASLLLDIVSTSQAGTVLFKTIPCLLMLTDPRLISLSVQGLLRSYLFLQLAWFALVTVLSDR